MTAAAGEPLSREEFERRRAAAKRAERREGLLLAAVSVGGGFVQLLFIRWADARLPRPPRVAIEGALFLVYIAGVGALLWRMQRRVRALRPVCPHCRVRMEGLADRVAGATGRCDRCGGQVIA